MIICFKNDTTPAINLQCLLILAWHFHRFPSHRGFSDPPWQNQVDSGRCWRNSRGPGSPESWEPLDFKFPHQQTLNIDWLCIYIYIIWYIIYIIYNNDNKNCNNDNNNNYYYDYDDYDDNHYYYYYYYYSSFSSYYLLLLIDIKHSTLHSDFTVFQVFVDV